MMVGIYGRVLYIYIYIYYCIPFVLYIQNYRRIGGGIPKQCVHIICGKLADMLYTYTHHIVCIQYLPRYVAESETAQKETGTF